MTYKRRKRTEAQWAETPPDVLRCTAPLKSTGEQCRWEAAPGTNVCVTHGALIPSVQAAAATRIQMSVDDAVKRLQRMLDDGNVDARDKIKILHDLLDRGGLAATSKHLVGVVSQDPLEKLFATILADPNATYDPRQLAPYEPDAEQLALNARADRQEYEDDLPALGYDEDDVLDAEVVEEPARAAKPEVVRTLPPKHIRDDLESLGLL